jgi:hypothetical protein
MMTFESLIQEFRALKQRHRAKESYRPFVGLALAEQLSREAYAAMLKDLKFPTHARKRIIRILGHAGAAQGFAAGTLEYRAAWELTRTKVVIKAAGSATPVESVVPATGSVAPLGKLPKWAAGKPALQSIPVGNYTSGLFQVGVRPGPVGEVDLPSGPPVKPKSKAPRLKFLVAQATAVQFERLGHQSGLNRAEAVEEYLARLDWEWLRSLLPNVPPPQKSVRPRRRHGVRPRLKHRQVRRDVVAIAVGLPAWLRTDLSDLATRTGLTAAALASLLLEPDPAGRVGEIQWTREGLALISECEPDGEDLSGSDPTAPANTEHRNLTKPKTAL